jgi:hypothetical protein
MHMGPACSGWLLLASFVLEMQQIMAQAALGVALRHPWPFIASALAGFAVNALSLCVMVSPGARVLLQAARVAQHLTC